MKTLPIVLSPGAHVERVIPEAIRLLQLTPPSVEIRLLPRTLAIDSVDSGAATGTR